MNTLSETFKVILTADKESSRKAAREVRKLVYGSSSNDRYKEIISIIETAPAEYAKITDDFRQENFVIAVSVMYFLHNRDSHPDFLFPWLFELLLHKNGNIRHAAVRMIEHEIGPLTYHLRFPGEVKNNRDLSSNAADYILLQLFSRLNNLLHESWRPEYRKYKYIDSLPSGTYRSVQLILSELEFDCGKQYVAHMENVLKLFPR